MAILTGTKVALAYVGESTRGITPGTPQFTILRAISRGVNLKKDILESAEVKQTRQRGDVRHGFQRTEGEVAFELAMESYNDMLLWGLGGAAWTTPTTCPNTAALSVTLNSPSAGLATIARTSGTFNFIDAGYRQGDFFTAANFSNAGNNGQNRVLIVNQASLVVGLGTMVAEAASASATITYVGKKAIIGTTLKTFTLEREFSDPTNPLYEIYVGTAINQMRFSARPESLVQMTLGLIGMNADIDRTATLDASAGYTAAPLSSVGSPPFAGIDTTLYVGGSSVNATGFDFALDNQRTLQGVLGSSSSKDVFEGQVKVSGSYTNLLQNTSMLTAFQDEVPWNQWTLRMNEVGSSDFLSITFYRVKETSHDMDPPTSGPVIQNVGFEALEETFTGATGTYKEVMHIQRSTTS